MRFEAELSLEKLVGKKDKNNLMKLMQDMGMYNSLETTQPGAGVSVE